MTARPRKRSAAISLVLAGSATLAGCGSPPEQRDAYSSLQNCVRDWNNAALCEPVRDGRFASSYFYGPPYYSQSSWRLFGGSRPQPSPNAMDAVRLQSGSVTSSRTGMLAMRTGAGPHSGNVVRSGFGSTGRAASSAS
jgi:hypothetical protein